MVDIDALDGAAALPGVEEAAVDQVFHRMLKIGVRPYVGRVLAAQFQPHADKTPHGGGLHGLAGLD
ncbi:hypothetical protein D3C81_2007440 [compost metagenome]